MTTCWGAGRSMPPPPRRSADDSPDMMRLARFRRDHPETAVRQGPGFWQAITPEGSGESIVTRYRLEELLDKLDPPDTS